MNIPGSQQEDNERNNVKMYSVFILKISNFVETLFELSKGGSIGTGVDRQDSSGMILYA